jgi:hypothetical protein
MDPEPDPDAVRYERQPHDEGGLVLKWWPMIAVMTGWLVLGLAAFNSVQRDVSNVSTELAAHERAQQDTINGMQRDLTYIRDRLDKALEKKQ